MNNIEWKEGAVCYAYGKQWFARNDKYNDLISLEGNGFANSYNAVDRGDFQLNEISAGDYLPKSELDTEQKYNDAVEVFGLLGFEMVKDSLSYSRLSVGATHYLASNDYGIDSVSNGMAFKNYCKGRQLTYSQIIAIGKLKRMMLEREYAKTQLEKWGEYSGDSNNSESLNSSDQVKNPSHYQLIEGVESIEIIARSMTQEQFKGYCFGNTLKYRLRAGKKDALQQDIDKANFYGDLYEMHKEKCYD